MRRADRLFAIVQALRGGRLVTAGKLARQLEVSERTIYRDMADLQGSGVPIEGEAGVGYVMADGYDLPPMMFSRAELVALVAGARMVRGFGGTAMAKAAEEALVKIGAVLPPDLQAVVGAVGIGVPGYHLGAEERARVDLIETAIAARQVLRLDYADRQGAPTQRDIQPLVLTFWGGHWTVIGWCRLRADFRMFRLHRMVTCAATGETFRLVKGQRTQDFRQRMIDSGELPAHFDFSIIGF